MLQDVQSFAKGEWLKPGTGARPIADAATGEIFAQAGGADLDFAGMIGFARERGGPALRAMTFHDRARILKALALHLNDRKEELYEVSYATGATRSDHAFDIDGGIGTLFVYASKGRRELPDAKVLIDGELEQFGKEGVFKGQHIFTPLRGVAVHINAFNFPVWGMLEKLAPSLLAGIPSIVKPATVTSYVTEACVKMLIESGLLPEGAVQLVAGGLGNTLDLLDCQDVVTFTGSAATAAYLKSNENLARNSVRFTAEQDSLNASILGPDAKPGTPEFDLFVKEVTREMTVKAGQKCTAIRRIIAPDNLMEPLIGALGNRLSGVAVGHPRNEKVKMGALVSNDQKADVLDKVETISKEAEQVFGNMENFETVDACNGKGAFIPPMLFYCQNPDEARFVHTTEAFGPISTVMGYSDLDHAIDLTNQGQGSLVASLVTNDLDVAQEIVGGIGAFHGRVYINNRVSMSESTGHGAPMPHMVHGGPGRAGGGEELGGIRGMKHFMQRTAVQGSPEMLSAIGGNWVPTSPRVHSEAHPFTKRFGELVIGQTLETPSRKITLEDIEHFAQFTGDMFYAHMDDAAASRNPFFPGRVAHGYLLISFAAGLFVEPNEGPVLANTGLDKLRFKQPVSPADAIYVSLTVMNKKSRNDEYGEVRWHVELFNQRNEPVAEYELLTMVAK